MFQKTRDAMVAFEAGAVEEKSGRGEEAVRWYTIAAQRFRRADWRQKAAEALTRLGAPIPEMTAPAAASSQPHGEAENGGGEMNETAGPQITAEDSGEAQPEELGATETQPSVNASVHAGESAKRPGRRRGRRGGRRHRRGGARNAAGQSHVHAPAHERHAAHSHPAEQAHAGGAVLPRAEEMASAESVQESESTDVPTARFVPEPSGPFAERVTYIRAGDPALASRFAQLESLLRRLISAPLHRVDELDEAPAGPGVFLLSDSDLMTNYYVEACRTLRIGTGQLARSGRAGKGARAEGKSSLRNQLAEHLEISDTQVNDYLKKHCVVRWLQLDESAAHLAHFAIALLRPALNTN
ncbi:MAG TPA: hypothetical protein VFU57_02905 [Candidatus Acidoferrales bacterium]|nr:hypothetical protein [Candidatus Acidoferrales bacterium]